MTQDARLTALGENRLAKQKRHVEALVKEYSDDINSFLKNSGMQYEVSLQEGQSGQHKLTLTHNDLSKGDVTDVKSRLSYGERNAFAIVLFAYAALKQKPDLIVLDDPISSFDKNKKYAIIDFLFKKEKVFRNKTVLFLTHDFEPVVDIALHHRGRFSSNTKFLENKNGLLSEKSISADDIKTVIEINNSNISASQSQVSKLIYLRRNLEVTNKKNGAYDMISSLIHKRTTAATRDGANSREMNDAEIQEATENIKEFIADFDYSVILSTLKDDIGLKKLYRATENNYEKLHIYRIFREGKPDVTESDVVLKFINETFHVETDYIYQLNPREYPVVPQYIINECDRIMVSS